MADIDMDDMKVSLEEILGHAKMDIDADHDAAKTHLKNNNAAALMLAADRMARKAAALDQIQVWRRLIIMNRERGIS